MDDTITLVSTTDSEEDVQRALGVEPSETDPPAPPDASATSSAPAPDTAPPVVEDMEEAVPSSYAKPQLDDVDENGDAKYANYEGWVEATTEWQINEARRQDAAQRNQTKLTAAYRSRLASFRKSTADFDAVIKAAANVETTPAIDGYVLHSEMGPAVLYALAQDPDEAARISALPPARQLVELGKIEARVGPKTSRSPAARRAKTSYEPINPVSGSGVSTDANEDGESYTAYKERRNREERSKPRY